MSITWSGLIPTVFQSRESGRIAHGKREGDSFRRVHSPKIDRHGECADLPLGCLAERRRPDEGCYLFGAKGQTITLFPDDLLYSAFFALIAADHPAAAVRQNLTKASTFCDLSSLAFRWISPVRVNMLDRRSPRLDQTKGA